MTFDEYRSRDATALAALVRNREVSPAELLELAIDRYEAVNDRINAVVSTRIPAARAEVEGCEPWGPFAGVPFLLKDLGLEFKGSPLSCGSQSYRGYVSDHDSDLVKRIRSVGLVVFGKTNTPEFGLTPYTEPAAYGPSRNPWNTDYTPGGSSGGSGAAVAAGIVPLATASDGGGSIRIPASNCGLFGLKTSRGLISDAPTGWGGGVVEGCVSRSVRDTAAYLDAVSARSPAGAVGFSDALAQPPAQTMRIGFSVKHPLSHAGFEVHSDCADAVYNACAIASDLGYPVDEIPLPWDADIYERDFLPVLFVSTAQEVSRAAAIRNGRLKMRDLEAHTRLMANIGLACEGDAYTDALNRWSDLSRRFEMLHQGYDLICLPTLARPPARVGQFQSSAAETFIVRIAGALGLGGLLLRLGLVGEIANRIFGYMPFTPIANMTGAPAVSLPLGSSADGLPVGVQFIAPRGSDGRLLRFSRQMEEAAPWFHRVPEQKL